jgi:hypothetical protein
MTSRMGLPTLIIFEVIPDRHHQGWFVDGMID